MDHYASGQPILLDAATADAPDEEADFDIQDDPADAEIITQIQDQIGLASSLPRTKWAAT